MLVGDFQNDRKLKVVLRHRNGTAAAFCARTVPPSWGLEVVRIATTRLDYTFRITTRTEAMEMCNDMSDSVKSSGADFAAWV